MCFAVIAYSGFYLLSNVPFSQPAPNYNSETPLMMMNSKQAERVTANAACRYCGCNCGMDATDAKHFMQSVLEFHINKTYSILSIFLKDVTFQWALV